jgi:hypothetical protein
MAAPIAMRSVGPSAEILRDRKCRRSATANTVSELPNRMKFAI